MSHGRSSVDIVKRRCNELNVSCEHFTKVHNSSSKKSLEEILTNKSTYKSTSHLKDRLVKEGVLKY